MIDAVERPWRVSSEVPDTGGCERPADDAAFDRGWLDSVTAFDRQAWVTPQLLVADVWRRLYP